MRSLVFLGLASIFIAAPAAADIGEESTEDSGVLSPSSRAGFASFGIGPSVGIAACGDPGCGDASEFTQVMLSQELGWHVSGDGEGFALGLAVGEGLGNHIFRFQPSFKMWWDIQPSDLAIYITPSLELGYALFHADAGGLGSADEHAFHAQLGAEVRLVLADRALLSLKPVGIDVYAQEDGVLVGYALSVNGGVTF
jgi:hypothetical protein